MEMGLALIPHPILSPCFISHWVSVDENHHETKKSDGYQNSDAVWKAWCPSWGSPSLIVFVVFVDVKQH